MNRIVTISRQFGSGGRTIGRQLAEKLGIPCYDQELIEKLAEKSGFSPEFVKERSEYAQGGGWLSNAFTSRTMNGMSPQDYLWVEQQKIITELAQQGDCVIVGRCADFILRDKANCLRVFIHADMASRAKRIVEIYGETDHDPEKRLKDKDRRRAAYHQFYTDSQWGLAKNYHITLDSGLLGIEQCVEILSRIYNGI